MCTYNTRSSHKDNFEIQKRDSEESFFSKHYFRNTFRVSNSLDPDQGRHFVGPDLGPKCSLKTKFAAGRQLF